MFFVIALFKGANLNFILFIGLFGFVILAILLVPMYYIKVGNMIFKNPEGRLEDALDAFVQIKNNWRVALALSGMLNMLNQIFFLSSSDFILSKCAV